MYNEYFGFSESPFSIAPDPRYLYLSDRHREALAHLIYGVGDQGGFILLTGEVGTGKTTVCRCLIQQIPDNVDLAIIVNPKQTSTQLLRSICDELSIDHSQCDGSVKTYVDLLNQHLLASHAQGRNTVLIIDEAQNLSVEVLEQLRLLTNLETDEKKLLQLVLLGQPELNELLAGSELRQLEQRITARYHLNELDRSQIDDYIRHRLSVSGCQTALFSPSAVGAIYRYTRGVPRLINLLCDRALLGAYSEESASVDARIVKKAAAEVLPPKQDKFRIPRISAVAALLILVFFGGVVWWQYGSTPTQIRVTPSVSEDLADVGSGGAMIEPGTGTDVASTSDLASSDVDAGVVAQPQSDGETVAKTDFGEEASVLAELFSLWPGQRMPVYCEQNGTAFCLTETTLESALRHNKPFVISEAAVGNYRLVAARSGDELVVEGEGKLTPLQLDQRFQGASALVLIEWPDTFNWPLVPGYQGEEVRWLREKFLNLYSSDREISKSFYSDGDKHDKFSIAMGELLVAPSINQSSQYDPELLSLVNRFQQEIGFAESTEIDAALVSRLLQRLDVSIPRLTEDSTEAL